MNRLYKIMFVFLTISVIVAFSISFYYTTSLSQKIMEIDVSNKNQNVPEYHFSVIVNDYENTFWQKFKKGVDEASKKYNVAVEFNGVSSVNDIDKSLEYMDIATLSDVDGIIVQAFPKESYKQYINNAEENGIPVVTVESDARKSNRTCFVGANSFEIGVTSVNFINEITNGNANIAIIFQDYYENQMDISSNLMLAGFKETINKINNMNIVTIEQSSRGLLSAEDITLDIIKNYPQVNMIFCTSAKDTLSSAQVIVDLNKVGDIKILGFDMSTEIEKYIDKGVVLQGTIGRRPKDIGFKCVEALYNIKKGDYPSDFIDTGIDIITTDNLSNIKDYDNYNNE